MCVCVICAECVCVDACVSACGGVCHLWLYIMRECVDEHSCACAGVCACVCAWVCMCLSVRG
jgi:hypothetical protein